MDQALMPMVESLEKVYGKASSAGFGSAVFYDSVPAGLSINSTALEIYKKFVGAKWKPDTEKAWMGPWKQVYERHAAAGAAILSELSSVEDAAAKTSIPLLTELISEPPIAEQALQAAFDHEQVEQLALFTVGDGEAMSGVLIIAYYKAGYYCSVIALID